MNAGVQRRTRAFFVLFALISALIIGASAMVRYTAVTQLAQQIAALTRSGEAVRR